MALHNIKRIGFVFFVVVTYSCSDHATGQISGKLCYPGEYIPRLNIYLKEINSGKIYRQTTGPDPTGYRFTNVLAGGYIAFAYTVEKEMSDESGNTFKGWGGYTQNVPCGLKVGCSDRTLIKINLDAGGHCDTINICDWYEANVPPEP